MPKENVLVKLEEQLTFLEEVQALLLDQCSDRDEIQKQLDEATEKIKKLELLNAGYVHRLEDLNEKNQENYFIDKDEQKNKYDESVHFFEKWTRDSIKYKNDNPEDLAGIFEKEKWVYLWKARMDLLLDLEDNKLRHPTKL